MFNDVISDILSSLRLESRRQTDLGLGAGETLTLTADPRSISFYLARAGQCEIDVPGHKSGVLKSGEFALVLKCATVCLSCPHDSGRTPAEVLRGECQFDEQLDHPLIAHLPALIILKPQQTGFPEKLRASLLLLSAEAGAEEQGRGAVVPRLIEIIFVQTVRFMATQGGQLAQGYSSAMNDPHLFRALFAIHKRWAEPWTMGKLAREAGMSRAVFARRFGERVGVPPITYLTQWRLMKARRLLKDTQLDMDEIAKRCGYASAPSLSRRFSAAFAIRPGAFRKSGGRANQ